MIRPAGLLDTSVLIARESGRPVAGDLLPRLLRVSVISIAELQTGVHRAADESTRTRRLRTLHDAFDLEPLTVDVQAAQQWAMLRARLADERRRANVNDLWIAAIALANELPVVTQDDDFDVIAEVGGPELIKV